MKKLIIYISIITIFSSCSKFFEPEPANYPDEVFENFWTVFNEGYSSFEERNVNWDSLYTEYRPLISQNTTDDELFSILSDIIKPLNDGHVTVTAPNKIIAYSNKIIREKIDDELFDLDVIKNNYLASDYKEDWGNLYGKIQNTAYIHFKYTSDNVLIMSDFLEENENADNFIIDLRHNGGGQFTYPLTEMRRFVKETTFTHRTKTKNGPGENDYTDWYEWNIEPEGEYIDKNIVLITDRYTISAGERFTMILKALPNVTHIGIATNGAGSTMVGRELANGWGFTIATQKVEMFDGKSYEGIGIMPDIQIQNTSIDIQADRDVVLEKALELLNQ